MDHALPPGRHDEFPIDPYGLMFDEITASSPVRIDLCAATSSTPRRSR